MIVDLLGQPVKKTDIKGVVDQLSLMDVFIRTDLKGFRTIHNLYKDWLSVPQVSSGVTFSSGGYLETGGRFVLQTSPDLPAGVNFHDTDGLDEGSVVAQLVNYN